MGNAQAPGQTSALRSSDMEDNTEAEDDDNDFECEDELDLGSAFRSDLIYQMASKVTRRESKVSMYEDCYNELLEGLERLEGRTDSMTVGFSQFCDILSPKNLSNEELLEIFEKLDYEGRGAFEVVTVLQTIKKFKRISLGDGVSFIARRFDSSSWMPGFVDAYVDQKDDFKQHGMNLLQFLHRNRLPSSDLQCDMTVAYMKMMKLREEIVSDFLEKLTLGDDVKSNAQETGSKEISGVGGDCPVLDGKDDASSEMSADRVIALWSIQLLTVTARASLPLNPSLLDMALQYSRNSIHLLQPLSLCHNSLQRPSFLTTECFCELASFIDQFPDRAEVLELLLSFHLASGNLSEILQCLTEISASTKMVDCWQLQNKLSKVRQQLLRNGSRVVKLSLCGSDCEKDTKNDPDSIAELHWNQNAFSTKTGQTRATFVFESSEWIEFSKIKIKVANGNCGSKFGFVIVLSEWPAAGDRSRVAEELEKFSSYDKWTKSDYDGMASAASGQKTLVNIGPMAFFDTENHDEVDVEMKHSVYGKWLMVKFLNARDSEADRLEIVGVKCFGVERTESHALLERQVIEKIQNAGAVQSNQLTVYSVLSFLLHVLANEKQTIAKDNYYFSRAVQVYVDQRTGFVKSSGSSGWLVAKCLFTQEFSYFEIEIVEINKPGLVIGAVPICHPSGEIYEMKKIPYGYCTASGRIYYNSHFNSTVSPSSKGDKIGIGFRYKGHMAKSVYFTKNGKEICTMTTLGAGDVYPAIAFESSGIQVRLLDKRPWRCNDASVLEKERRRTVAGRSEFINPRYIDLSKVTVDSVWELQKIFSNQLDQSFILQLLNSMLPWSIPGVVQLKNSSEIFDRLCHIVDLENESGNKSLVLAASDLIMNGIDLFYPLKDDRLKLLFELLNSPSTSASKSVIFQSLCRSFSRADMDDILSLPSSPLQELDSSGFLSTMEKLLSLSFQESSSLLKPAASNDTQSGKVSRCGEQILCGRKKSDHQLYLTQLLDRLQLQLFGWIRIHLRNPAEAEETEKHLLHYCSHLVVSKVEALLHKMTMLKDSDVGQILLELEASALATTFPALALLLSQLSSDLSAKSKIKLLEVLKTSLTAVSRVLAKVPELDSEGSSDESKESETELKCWEVESLHDVPNIEEVVKIFSFPEATIFEVEFDRKTGSQHSDDYLEFSDSKGNTELCMGRFNRHNNPHTLKFENSSYLRFIYRPETDSSPAYGYKFKVRAKKAVAKRFHWLYDLYLGLCRLFGRLSGSLLDKSPVFPKSATAEDKIEAEMYRSELWTTIFRGGLVIKKFERSLSGNYETEDQSDVAELVYQLADLGTEKAKVFLERCKDHKAQSHGIGGEEIDRAVRSVFSALLWHTQSLRHDVSIYLRNELDGKISSGILEAYAAAEKLRLVLIAKRQSQRKEEEEMSLKDEEDRKPVVDVVSLVEDKARFLLRFAGLSKVASKTEESKRRLESRISRHVSLSRCLSREPTVDLDIPVGTSKYPSFNLVFEFVQDAAWSCEKVEELLKRRCSHCEDLWKAYMLVCDCLRTVSDGHCNKLPCKIFLNELMLTQKKFGRHYADGLDGCGLALEANIRLSYYDLLRFMVSTLRKEEDKFKQGGYDIFASYTLHLLDISWQAFDFPFLVELRLPELYFSLASVFSSAIEQKPPLYGVDETQEEYERTLVWGAKASLDLRDFHTENNEFQYPEQMLKYIVAKFKKSSFRCDGCAKDLSVNYYRCLGCVDFDLCLECHEKEYVPSSRHGVHSPEHELILFKYTCTGCKGFITGTRWHCKVCDNLDLCNGCYKASNFPSESGHISDHGVSSFPTPKITQEYNKVIIKNPLEFYTYQHSWMLFVALSYDTLDFLSRRSSEQKADDSYLFAARQLLAMTYNLTLDYLISCLDSGDVVDSAIVDSSSTETEVSKPEANTHSSDSQENTRPLVTKTIGLITSLVSSRKKVPTMKDVMEVLTSEQFLFTLFDIARAEKVIDLKTRLMSLGLLSRLLQRMDISSQASESLKSEDGEVAMIVDKKVLRMVQSLFDFGADCLEKRDLELAKAASEMLHTLQRNQNWTKLLSHRCSEIVSFLDKEPSLSSIFALFAFTGFPEMLTVGTLVRISNTDGDATHGVVLCNKKEDDKKSSVVELSSRQTIKVDEMSLDVVTSDVLHLTDNQISLFFSFITNAIDQIKNGVEYSTKSMWTLALAIKAALNSVNFSGCRTNGKFHDRSFLGCMNYLASLGTWLPKSLLLQDLEILSLGVDQSSEDLPSPTVEAADQSETSEESDEQEEERGVAEEISRGLEIFMTEEQRIYYQRMMNMGARMTQSSSAAEKKKAKEDPILTKDLGIDMGLSTMPNLSDVLTAEVDVGDGIEESNLQKPELISSVDGEAIVTQKKTSKKLMKEQLKNASDSGFPLKIVRALAIRYARHLLMAIISEWPEDGDQFTPQHIGCDNIADVFFLVNLLGSSFEAEASLAKIVKRLISYCQPTDVDTIARASGFFVGASEGQTVSIVRQIPHPTGKVLGSGDGGDIVDGKACFRDEVYIPGATALNIRFEERFCAESDFELKFSSFPDLSENVQCFINISSDDWNDFNINIGGDRVYCVLAISEAKSSCFKIKVTGILSFPDCFNIGYMALDTILDTSEVVSFLPLKYLWRQLVSVANSSSKAQRLKVIRLLLRILSLQTKRSGCETPSVDLSYLRGLWKMYKKHTQDNETETIKPALVLALTELFFIAENVAQEWNIAEQFALSMEDDTQLKTQDEKQ